MAQNMKKADCFLGKQVFCAGDFSDIIPAFVACEAPSGADGYHAALLQRLSLVQRDPQGFNVPDHFYLSRPPDNMNIVMAMNMEWGRLHRETCGSERHDGKRSRRFCAGPDFSELRLCWNTGERC